MQAVTATLFHFYTFFHDNNGDFKPRTLFVGRERCPVALSQFFVVRRPLFKKACDGLVFSTSVANETENLITKIWFKL